MAKTNTRVTMRLKLKNQVASTQREGSGSRKAINMGIVFRLGGARMQGIKKKMSSKEKG